MNTVKGVDEKQEETLGSNLTWRPEFVQARPKPV
jgi:hypothetical protein